MLLFQLLKSISDASGHHMNHSVGRFPYVVFGLLCCSLSIYRIPDRVLEVYVALPSALQSDILSILDILANFHIVNASAKLSDLTAIAPYAIVGCSTAPAHLGRCLQNTLKVLPLVCSFGIAATSISNFLSTPLVLAIFIALSAST
jgi:hypothetical protein